MLALIDFHHDILFYLIFILAFVCRFLAKVNTRFSASFSVENKSFLPVSQTTFKTRIYHQVNYLIHDSKLELI